MKESKAPVTPDYAEIMDGIDAVVGVVKGARLRLEAEGFSPTAAEIMAVGMWDAMMRNGQGTS